MSKVHELIALEAEAAENAPDTEELPEHVSVTRPGRNRSTVERGMTKYYDAGDVDLDEEVVLDSNGNRITEARAQEMAEGAAENAPDTAQP